MAILTENPKIVKIPLSQIAEELRNVIIALLEIERYETDLSFQ